MDTDIRLAGQIDGWPTKDEMASILRGAGLTVTVGRYSVRINDCEHFVLQEYGGDLGAPCFDADADTLAVMLHDSRRVSDALAAANLRHRLELYNQNDELVGYVHHRWPQLPGFDGPPYETNLVYCPTCTTERTTGEFEYLCVVPELGNLVRYRCTVCGDSFTELPPSATPERHGD